jgi:hypothetical protein
MKTKTMILTRMIVLLFLLIGAIGCEEEKNNPIEDPPFIENSGTLLGTWYWKKTNLPGAPSASNPQTPQNSGIIKSLVLKNDSSWTLIEDGKATSGDKFTIGKGVYSEIEASIFMEYDSICFYRDNKIVDVDYYELHDNTLYFCGCFRGEVGGGGTLWKYISTN